jgi:EpsI family protein
MKNLRFLTAVVLLAGTLGLLHSRPDKDLNPPSEPLSSIPNEVAGYTGSDREIDQESLDILGAGDFLSRIYTRGPLQVPIGLFVAYFPTQRTGVSIHSPKHCLPGAGWYFESSQYVDLKDAEGKPHRVGEYIIANGERKQFVIYWYQAHGRSVADEYWAKVYMVLDAIRMNRTDGALVRVITPMGADEDVATAKARAEGFAAQLAPVLPRFIPN